MVPMRILIIGGTKFVGRHITEAALAAGHDVTLLNRGATGSDLFPGATHLTADRNEDLGVLAGSRWDATIDVCGYFPRQVAALASALDGNGGRYVYISSVSAYEVPEQTPYSESSPLQSLPPGPEPTEVTYANYGALKAACEKAAHDHFGPSTLVIRPTYVVGPHDHTGRFGYWVHRIAQGGEVLAPGHADRAIQVIDARDQAEFVMACLSEETSGAFHTVVPTMGFGALLDAIAAEVAPAGTTLTWVDPDFLLAAGESDETLPLWYAGMDGDALTNTADPAAALEAGLVLRPLAGSIRDVLADERQAPSGRYLSPERETELLAQWSATGLNE
jgi:2'-hydroxyisoflavone reductase